MIRLLLLLALAIAAPAAAQVSPLAPQAAETPRAYLPLVGGAPASPSALRVTLASYLGTTAADSASAVAIAPDGSVLVGGVLPSFTAPQVATTNIAGGGPGAIVRVSADGTAVRGITRIGQAVSDMEISDAGQLAVCGDFGVALLSADASTARWVAAPSPGAAARCSVGADGAVAALVGSVVHVYAAGGAALGSWSVPGTAALDVAVDGVGQRVVAAGYTQVSGSLQLPYLRAYSYAGALLWTSYGFADAPGLGADTRAERVAIGADGKLYMAGSINGGTGASVFSRDPKDIALRLGADRLITSDSFTNPSNVGSVKMAWFGRFSLANGALERAQSLLTRLSSGRGNSISIRGIAADASGKVLLVGDTACCIASRDSISVAGVTAGPYESGEGYFLATPADFRERTAWVVFAAPGASAGGSPLAGVAVRGGKVALVGTRNPGAGAARAMITTGSLSIQPGAASDSEAYLVIAPAP